MAIFTRFGLQGAFTIAHVVVAIMWMGLLWFFNFVQTPAYAEMDPAARNNAFDKLTWRTLWWFRWAAAATVAFGLIIIGVAPKDTFGGDFWKSTAGVTLLIGILFGIVMLYNVWMVIWPNQQIVIANARNVLAGGEADPNAPAAARAGAMASRQNTIFSVSMVWFMVLRGHGGVAYHSIGIGTGPGAAYWIIVLLIVAVLEVNALGLLPWKTAANKGLNVIYDGPGVRNPLIAAFGLWVIFVILGEIVFS